MSRRMRNVRSGFTLIEVMIVIAIVLALAALVGFNLLGQRDKAERDLAKIDMQTVQRALKQFRFDHGRYPTDEEGLRVLWDKEALTDENDRAKWTKLLDKAMPNDRFGNQWGYRQQSEHTEEAMYDLWSYGPDRQEGTDDDIRSWDDLVTSESGGTGSGAGAGESTGGTP